MTVEDKQSQKGLVMTVFGTLPDYRPPPILYCNLRGFYCNAYREDPCPDCPYDISITTVTEGT